jgi:hypothetical protein
VMVVVTRWYGGVPMGPDRFRVINAVRLSLTSCGVRALIQTLHSQVGKEALEMGGFVSKPPTKPAKQTKKR